MKTEELSVELEKARRKGRKNTLQKRFLLGVGIMFLFFSILSAVWLYLHERRLLEEDALGKSRLVMAVMEANRSYVQDVLRPRMYELTGKDAFVREAMSTSYVSRAVMERFKAFLPEYSYRRVSQNARNPDSEPTRFESELIGYFASRPEEHSRRGIVPIDGSPHFLHARPVRFDDSCMHCHGRPEDAPQALVDLYGPERGFGYQPGAVSGLMAVSIPVDVALIKIKGRAISVFLACLIAFSALYVAVCFFFNRVVIHNLRNLLQLFRRSLRDENEFQLLRAATAKDEIGELTAAAETVAGHLQAARRQSEEYARTLEAKVSERTGALVESKRRLREKAKKTRESLTLLTTIAELTTRSTQAGEIFPSVLRQALSAVPARGGALYLLRDNPSRLEMQCSENIATLPSLVEVDPEQFRTEPSEQAKSPLCETFLERLRAPSLLDSQNDLAVPLCCRGRVLGMLVFTGVEMESLTPEIQDMLLSIGQQIGITIESLQNTEAKKRVDQKIQQTEKLAAVGQLAAGIAHEINNPLGVILCHTELLEHQLNGPGEAHKDLGVIKKHALGCQRIVSDLLKFARRQESAWQLTPLNRAIEEVVGIVSHQFRSQQVEISLDLATDIPLMNMDIDKFKQVCMNLLLNARQAIQGKGEVRVSTRYDEVEKSAQIVFRDNGSGVAPEIRERIFDPFFTTKKTGEGTGLGLSVSFGIIKDHGGDIQMVSEPGRFTEFTITLPLDAGSRERDHE